MNIGKFTGKTKEEALGKAKEQLGANAVIMNEKTVKPKGILKFLKKPLYEITAAVEDAPAVPRPKASGVKAQEAYKDAAYKATGESEEIPKDDERKTQIKTPDTGTENEVNSTQLKKRIEDLQNMLEEKLDTGKDGRTGEANADSPIIKLIRDALLNNEVDERYADRFIGEVRQTVTSASELDVVLPNVYQKLVLKFGQPQPITLSKRKPKVVFFIGPTGVGKTTTIAKIASRFKVEMDKKVALVTSDTYRIAATDQLRTYAGYLDIPLYIVYGPDELKIAVDNYSDYDLILVDTAGFSHKNKEQRDGLRDLLDGISGKAETEIFLVLSATTKYKDLLKIVETYAQFTDYKIIFTKLDETDCYGNLLNIRLHTGADMSYLTTGQNVPQDIEVFNAQKIVKQLLGGK